MSIYSLLQDYYKPWANLYISNLQTEGNITTTGNNLTIGSTTTDSILAVTGHITGDLTVDGNLYANIVGPITPTGDINMNNHSITNINTLSSVPLANLNIVTDTGANEKLALTGNLDMTGGYGIDNVGAITGFTGSDLQINADGNINIFSTTGPVSGQVVVQTGLTTEADINMTNGGTLKASTGGINMQGNAIINCPSFLSNPMAADLDMAGNSINNVNTITNDTGTLITMTSDAGITLNVTGGAALNLVSAIGSGQYVNVTADIGMNIVTNDGDINIGANGNGHNLYLSVADPTNYITMQGKVSMNNNDLDNVTVINNLPSNGLNINSDNGLNLSVTGGNNVIITTSDLDMNGNAIINATGIVTNPLSTALDMNSNAINNVTQINNATGNNIIITSDAGIQLVNNGPGSDMILSSTVGQQIQINADGGIQMNSGTGPVNITANGGDALLAAGTGQNTRVTADQAVTIDTVVGDITLNPAGFIQTGGSEIRSNTILIDFGAGNIICDNTSLLIGTANNNDLSIATNGTGILSMNFGSNNGSTNLNYYGEDQVSVTFSCGATSVGSIPIFFTRIGNLVSMSVGQIAITPAVGLVPISSSGAIPAQFRPGTSLIIMASRILQAGTTYFNTCWSIGSNGDIAIYLGVAGTSPSALSYNTGPLSTMTWQYNI